MIDIEGKEINVGDDCIMKGWNGVYRVKIFKETERSIQYYTYMKDGVTLYGYKEYVIKSGSRAKMYKI